MMRTPRLLHIWGYDPRVLSRTIPSKYGLKYTLEVLFEYRGLIMQY